MRREIKKWANTVQPKLWAWPVSKAVAHTIIDGVVVNRMICRLVVNTPGETYVGQCWGVLPEYTGMPLVWRARHRGWPCTTYWGYYIHTTNCGSPS